MNYTKLLLCTIILVCFSAFKFENKPKVLIIGDSISIGYTPFVKEQLKESAEVFHNPGNAQHTGTGLKKIKDWIGTEDWDIIQFNWGLWDLCYRHPDSKVQGKRDKVNGTLTFGLEDYEENLDSIINIIKETSNAKLIFVATSYVPKNEAGRFKRDAIKYNKVALQVMKKYNVLVNDVYKTSKQIHKEYGKGSDDVHYKAQGYKALGKLISEFLIEHL